MKRIITLFMATPLVLLSLKSFAQPDQWKNRKQVSLLPNEFNLKNSLPKVLKEASGLYIDENKNYWSHNDDTHSFLYCFDSTGKILKTVYLNHPNNGWEDLASDREHNIYIGAFGNNKNNRKDLTVYKLNAPNKITTKVTQAEIIRYEYEDQKEFPPPVSNQKFDADALISFRDSLYIFTKNRTKPFSGYTHVYQLPQSPGKYVAHLVDSIFLGNQYMMDSWVTGADVSPDQNILALLGHDKIWLILNFQGLKFSTGDLVEIVLPNYTHKAGISFYGNDLIYIVDETEFDILGGNLYQLDISRFRE